MRIARHVSAWIGGGILGLALAAGCRSPGLPSVSGPPLRIGVVEDAPPLVFRDHRRWRGVEADLGRALAARLGQRPVFVPFPPAQLEAALFDGKVDVLMAGLAVTEERRVKMDFSTPYLVVGQAALVRAPDRMRVNTLQKLTSARGRVGVLADSVGDRLVSRYFSRAIRQPFPDLASAADALREGRIDMIVHDAPTLWWIARQYEPAFVVAPPLFAKEEIAWAFRRSSISLRESANQALADWQKDGTLETVLRRWLPVSR